MEKNHEGFVIRKYLQAGQQKYGKKKIKMGKWPFLISLKEVTNE